MHLWDIEDLDLETKRITVSRNVKFNEVKKIKDSIKTDIWHANAEETINEDVADTTYDEALEDVSPPDEDGPTVETDVNTRPKRDIK